MNKKIYFAVKGLVIDENRFLILHKSDSTNGWWELPGGRMEFGETAEQTLTREVKEETGLNVEPVKLLDTWNAVFNNYQITGIIYLCNIKSGKVTLSPEHDKYKWITVDENKLSYMHPVFKVKMIKWNWKSLIEGYKTQYQTYD